MDNETLFGYSTSISERITTIKETGNKKDLLEWRKRKTFMIDDDFTEMLLQNGISEDDYCKAITPLSEDKLSVLHKQVQETSWFKLHKEIFGSDIPPTVALKTALRFHLSYFMKKLEQIISNTTNISIPKTILDKAVRSFEDELSRICMRTLVWDVHDFSERIQLENIKQSDLTEYINARFSNNENTSAFFNEYPTLSKILAIRLQFALQNSLFFFKKLSDNILQIAAHFNVSPPFYLTNITFSLGDSHNNGKSPIIFSINNYKIVFKFQDSQLLQAYNKLLTYIESLDSSFHFKKIVSFGGTDFIFMEFIEHKSCNVVDEIREYYKNYGILVAITYWLNSSDLHMENLVAHGQFPVIIDIETILHADIQRDYPALPNKNQILNQKNVALSGLLPMKQYWKKQIELSALNGQSQKIPFKIRKLINENSMAIRYELAEYYISDKQNIPLLNNEKIDFSEYIEEINNGFMKMSLALLSHKSSFIKCVASYFSNCTLRVLLRDTHDYANYLSFANHPSCMFDCIERDKILENLWNNFFANKKVVQSEITALEKNDIPYFYANTSQHSIFTENTIYTDILKCSPLETFTLRANALDNVAIYNAHIMLRENLNCLELKPSNIRIANYTTLSPLDHLKKATLIGDFIIEHLIIDDEHDMVIWPDIIHKEDELIIDYPESNLYNGSGGLLLFYNALNKYSPKPTYKTLIEILEKEIFINPFAEQQYLSAFWGEGCRLTIATYSYELTGEKQYKVWLENSLNNLFKLEPTKKIEWLYGNASLMAILARIYRILPAPEILAYIHKLLPTQDLIDELDTPGFAHGYAGVLYGLCMIYPYFNAVEPTIKHLVKKLDSMHSEINKLASTWCNGKLGIYFAMQKSRDVINHSGSFEYKTLTEPLLNSTLCHGNLGLLEYNLDCFISGKISIKDLNFSITSLTSAINFSTDTQLCPLGLFNGLSGLGYQLLRLQYPNTFKSVLLI